VTVAQVARVSKGFADAGVLVHAYLMYGFPTQTVQETVDSLEYVRQLFENGCIQSGFSTVLPAPSIPPSAWTQTPTVWYARTCRLKLRQK